MSAGKKVFTHVGESLAEFLLQLQNSPETDSLKLIADKLNNLSYTNPITNLDNLDNMTKQEIITYFKNELFKELNFYKVTDGFKEITLQEAIQNVFNNLKHLETLSEAQFQALAELTTERLANLFFQVGSQNRKFTINFQQLAKQIADLVYKPLDYFAGGEEDRDRIYYRFSADQLLVSDGTGNKINNFKEVFRVNAIVDKGKMILGEDIVVGGTELDSPFKKVKFVKEINATRNIILTNGAELYGTAVKARYADLAEWYSSNIEYDSGTLVQIEQNQDFELVVYDPSSEMGCFGIVSENPGLVLNEKLETDYCRIPIVLNGQSPVKIDGICKKGDYIYPSLKEIGMATAISPKNKRDFENKNPLARCLGICLENNLINTPVKANCRIW